MTIPIDRLYQYVEQCAQEIFTHTVVIYRFWPHGSKNLNDLSPLRPFSWKNQKSLPRIFCCDQEPMDYNYHRDFYNHNDFELERLLDQANLPWHPRRAITLFEKTIVLHSELQSLNLEKYQNDMFIPVYYWSHAIIARDWFRYAEYENFKKQTQTRFLIYNRAWSGTREYRLKFTELLIENNLLSQCKTFCNPYENQIHYSDYEFKNSQWQPTIKVENYVESTNATSNYSGDFDSDDYNSTDIEIVLETLFDDNRLHLTEKSLRPIACGQPFMLMAPAGSLQYIKNYGFQTFDTVWDESYDTIVDPYQRMQAVIATMKSIANCSQQEYEKKILQARMIADYNKKYFFSQKFFDTITNELKNNLAAGFDQLRKGNNFINWIQCYESMLEDHNLAEFLQHRTDVNSITIQNIREVLDQAHDLTITPVQLESNG